MGKLIHDDGPEPEEPLGEGGVGEKASFKIGDVVQYTPAWLEKSSNPLKDKWFRGKVVRHIPGDVGFPLSYGKVLVRDHVQGDVEVHGDHLEKVEKS